ncbi:ABC transporter permease [Clostridiales bacterium BX7]|uniref:ABC transporter permease n=1 Tax=Feifania hominis TaxID=2763660 RepID=A0A926DEL9_9FIRM|nr:ABC transporter permease [Feifania hominis]MBC8536427.1 ABC transporter permease [Feifania hominis]
MVKYVLKRILQLIPVLIAVIFLIYVLQFMAKGDPALMKLGPDATPEQLEEWRESYGLNDPLLVQFGKYLWGIVTRGDLGTSYRTGQSVTSEILARWPVTFVLAIATNVVGFSLGLILGVVSALNRDTWKDNLARVFGMLGSSIPTFWFALMLIILFAVQLKWFPVSGWYGPKYWVLPALAQGILSAAAYMRNVRASVLDNVRQDFVRTARAKGQKESVVVWHHIMGNAMIPIVTAIGMHFATALGGTMIIEQMFAIPGLGRFMVESINNRDFPQLRASIILTAITVTVINLLIDVAYAFIDPRIKGTFARSAKRSKKRELPEEGGAAA